METRQRSLEIDYNGRKFYVTKFGVKKGLEIFSSCLAIFGAPVMKLFGNWESSVSDPNAADALSQIGRNFLKDDAFGALQKLLSDIKFVSNGSFIDFNLETDIDFDYPDLMAIVPQVFQFQFQSFLVGMGPYWQRLQNILKKDSKESEALKSTGGSGALSSTASQA